MAGGAYTNGSQWIDASSRDYKENIKGLNGDEAMEVLAKLNPVKFNYKAQAEETHVGFIAEDVPELVATKDRKGMSPMDVVAVLTKVVKEQRRVMEKQESIAREQQESLKELKARNEILEQRLLALEGKAIKGN